jgi:hypothetical protein
LIREEKTLILFFAYLHERKRNFSRKGTLEKDTAQDNFIPKSSFSISESMNVFLNILETK